ncbi:MAG: hypothetical protein QW757_01970, partial [Candidatus Woesearchaeota archaeon]
TKKIYIFFDLVLQKMSKCEKCNKKATIVLKTFQACNSCFIKIIEQRVRKEIRETKIFNDFLKNNNLSKGKKKQLILINDKSLKYLFNKYFFSKFLSQNFNKKIEIKEIKINPFTKNEKIGLINHLIKKSLKELKNKKLEKTSKIFILPWLLDDESSLFIESIFNNKKTDYLTHFYYNKSFYFKPLIHLSYDELVLYLKIKKIITKNNANKKKLTEETILNNLLKEYPEINFAILKSENDLKKQIIL